MPPKNEKKNLNVRSETYEPMNAIVPMRWSRKESWPTKKPFYTE